MIKYIMSAAALKGFSCTRSTRRLYRLLGNTLGARKRKTGRIPSNYFARMEHMLSTYKRHGLLKEGGRLLEVGTGWFHWGALTTRLFYDVEPVLLDVWDNRQFAALKNYARQIDAMLDELKKPAADIARARSVLARVHAADGWEDLYRALGFSYVIDEAGTLEAAERGSFDIVMSAGVMEHVDEGIADRFVQGIAEALKPGAYTYNWINIRDHLQPYDRSVSEKQYLRYSDHIWSCCFDNKVQHINRIQRSKWLELFEKAGLELVEETVQEVDISNLKIAPCFRVYDDKDLRCGGVVMLHRKPA